MTEPIAIKKASETDWEVIYGTGKVKAVRQFTVVNGKAYHVNTKIYHDPGQEPMRFITGTKIIISIGIFYLIVLAGPNIMAGLGTLGNEFIAGLGRLLGG